MYMLPLKMTNEPTNVPGTELIQEPNTKLNQRVTKDVNVAFYQHYPRILF